MRKQRKPKQPIRSDSSREHFCIPSILDIKAPELIIVLAIIVLLLGVGRVAKVAAEPGKGVREFCAGLSGKVDAARASETEEASSKTVEG